MEMKNVTNINNVSRVSRMIKRGDILWVNFGKENVIGSEQSKELRPAIVIQNNIGNKFSPVVIVALITSKLGKRVLPTHVSIGTECGLETESIILGEQIKSIDKRRIISYVGKATQSIMDRVDRAIEISVSVGGAKYTTMSREEQLANIKAQQIHSVDNVLKELIQENESLKLIEKYTTKRMNRINELEAYCKLNKLDYTRFYSVVTDTREKQYK